MLSSSLMYIRIETIAALMTATTTTGAVKTLLSEVNVTLARFGDVADIR